MALSIPIDASASEADLLGLSSFDRRAIANQVTRQPFVARLHTEQEFSLQITRTNELHA